MGLHEHSLVATFDAVLFNDTMSFDFKRDCCALFSDWSIIYLPDVFLHNNR